MMGLTASLSDQLGPRVVLDDATRQELLDLAQSPASDAVKGAPLPEPLPVSDVAITAAISDTFLAEDLRRVPGATPAEIDAILTRSGMVMIGRQRRLRLADASRAQLLRTARDTGRITSLLSAAHDADRSAFDQVTADEAWRTSAWLRCFLVGNFGNLAVAPVDELRAALSALERLRDVPLGPDVPRFEEARRLLELAELLEPLRLLIGASGGWDGTAARDRFVGRTEELRMLRSFVDELGSQSASEAVVRFTVRVMQSVFAGPAARTLVIEASGGLGKTALIAKFVLDHALGGTRNFPFAYLDFDSAALQPREPRLLLAEVARQVALQFPELQKTFEDLRQQVRAQLAGDTTASSGDPFGTFRSLLSERVTHGSRAFLLVLDTMEVVQFDPRAIEGVLAFVRALHDVPGGFPELRVVAAGRADIPELRAATPTRAASDLFTLAPLALLDAVAMAERLGKDLLGAAWRPEWAVSIAGTQRSPPMRREPLTIRVAVDLLGAGKDAAERQHLAEEIRLQGDATDTDIVAVLYQKRVIEYVRDPEVQALAWPGLMLRRVTAEIAEQVLAKPCNLTPDQARSAFEKLGHEVWIVQREGEALRHRPDLRARMMPLMRRYRKDGQDTPGRLFHELNLAAIGYYGARLDKGAAFLAEWIYHRLLDGERVAEVERDWDPEIERLLAGAENDVEPGSEAADFLTALTAARPLPTRRITSLPPRLALEHLARTAQLLGESSDVRLLSRLRDLQLEDAVREPLTSPARAAAFVLAVKTGRWRLGLQPSEAPGEWQLQQDAAVSYLRARAHLLGDDWAGLERTGRGFATPRSLVVTLAQDLAAAVLWQLPGFESADKQLAMALQEPLRLKREDGPALRLAIALGRESHAPALRCWLAGFPSLWWEKEQPTLSLAEARALALPVDEVFGSLRAPTDEAWSKEPAATRAGQALRAEGGLVLELLPQRLRQLQGMWEEGQAAIRRYAAARDEDWLIPMAYAAWRASGGQARPEVAERLQAQDKTRRALLFGRGRGIEGDILQRLRRADEASDLAGTVRLFAAAGQAGSDLQGLLDLHAAWRRRLDVHLAGQAKEMQRHLDFGQEASDSNKSSPFSQE